MIHIVEVARREARKAFLALSSDAGPNTAHSKLTEEEDTGKDLDLPANDDDRFYKTVPVSFYKCSPNYNKLLIPMGLFTLSLHHLF